jgi:hypothetical protein
VSIRSDNGEDAARIIPGFISRSSTFENEKVIDTLKILMTRFVYIDG